MAENAEPFCPTQKSHQPDAEQPANASTPHSNPQKAAQNESNHQPRAIPLTTKKRPLPKRRAATSIYQKKNRSNAKPKSQPRRAGAKQLPSGQNPTEVPLCGSPGEGKYIRSIASSARAGEHLMCSPCESGLSEQATLYICPPRGSSPVSPASSSASSAAPGSVHRGGQARCRRWGSPA